MKRPTNIWLATLVVSVATGAVNALAADEAVLPSTAAQDVVIPSTASNDRPVSDPTTAPKPQTFDGVAIVNGGVGSEQVAAVKQLASQYKLRVEISGHGGDYLVADRMQLMRGATVVAAVPNAGPWLLIDVPPGRYTLVGEFAGKQVRRDITVPDSGTTVHWVVPASVAS